MFIVKSRILKKFLQNLNADLAIVVAYGQILESEILGLTKKVSVGICGDAKLVAQQILINLSSDAGNKNREERKALIHQTKSAWLQTLSSMDHEDDDPGTTWNNDARERDSDRISPRMAWRVSPK